MRVPEKQKRKNRVIGHYIYSLQLFESRFNFQRKGEREKKRLDTPQIPDPGQSGGKRVSARLLASPVYGLRRLPIFVAFLNRRVGADYREKMYVPHQRAEHVFQREPITLFFSLPSLSLSFLVDGGGFEMGDGPRYIRKWSVTLRKEAQGIGLRDDLNARSFFLLFEKLGNLGSMSWVFISSERCK